MPRPKGSTNKTSKTDKTYVPKKPQMLTCAGHGGEPLKASEFFVSYHAIHSATGRLPYCKKCLNQMILDDNGCIDMEKVKQTLKLIDRPFIYDLWQLSLDENPSSIFGTYMKNLGLKQNRGLVWADSEFLPSDKNKTQDSTPALPTVGQATYDTESIIIDDKMREKWGEGYKDFEYVAFEKKWKKLIDNYGEKTSLHTEGLITYIRFRVKEELATARGDVREAKEWGMLASNAAKDGKINVSQLSKSDISGGVDLLPQLFEAVESEVGIIPVLPYLKAQPYDDADLIIWCVINYLRRLDDKPRIEYRDIWGFYDEMLHEHFKQKGYTDEMIAKEKRKRNNVFRDLGEVYKEPLYEDGDL